jgi:hypothetical protein
MLIRGASCIAASAMLIGAELVSPAGAHAPGNGCRPSNMAPVAHCSSIQHRHTPGHTLQGRTTSSCSTVQEKLDAERAKRKRAELDDTQRQQREIQAQINRAREQGGPAADLASAPEDRGAPLLQLDERAKEGEVLQLSLGASLPASTNHASTQKSAEAPSRPRAFDSLQAPKASAAAPSHVPAKKKSKVFLHLPGTLHSAPVAVRHVLRSCRREVSSCSSGVLCLYGLL